MNEHTHLPAVTYLINALAGRGQRDNKANSIPLNLVLKLFPDNGIAILLPGAV